MAKGSIRQTCSIKNRNACSAVNWIAALDGVAFSVESIVVGDDKIHVTQEQKELLKRIGTKKAIKFNCQNRHKEGNHNHGDSHQAKTYPKERHHSLTRYSEINRPVCESEASTISFTHTLFCEIRPSELYVNSLRCFHHALVIFKTDEDLQYVFKFDNCVTSYETLRVFESLAPQFHASAFMYCG